MVGVDGKGDCKLGEVNKLDFNGRIIDFLPIVHFSRRADARGRQVTFAVDHNAVRGCSCA